VAFALSKNWLIDDYNINYSTSSLIDKLTPAGLEIDNVDKILELDNTFVVGEIISVKKHSKADKLSVCQVSIGNDELLQIVCGCSSVAQGLKVVVATVGSKMPNGLEIKSCKLRGEVSNGMLCSANELGLNEISEGILHLESDAKLGVRVSEYFLQREDDVLQVEITPNRGDCLSVLGLAREINSLHYIKDDIMSNFDVYNIKYNDLPIKLIADNGCEVYEAVKIDNLDLTQKTPRWILNRLSLFGQKSVNLCVDIVNYVMFELGQPMHGFAVDKVDGQIFINWANEEKVVLLDKSEILLNKEDLVICDESGVLALAGIMGSDRALVDSSTTSVILEAACFNSNIIARSCRKHVISSESAYIF
jgi:phenylalanyl-tRNA synthetase beta chain